MAEQKITEPTKPLNAKKVIDHKDIVFKAENKTTAVISCIPPISIVMFFVEREDLFVRYMAAQYTLLSVVPFLAIFIVWVPCIGQLITLTVAVALMVMIIVGIVKVSQGVKFDIPVVKDLAIKLMNAI